MTDPLDTRALRDIAKSALLLESHYRDISVVKVVNAIRSAADELDRLRALIEHAPHGRECAQGWKEIGCDCWKADAL